MNRALRRLITVLAVLMIPAMAGAAEDPPLVITSAEVDHSTYRLVIRGQGFTATGNNRDSKSAHPQVTLDLQPLVVESATAYEIVLAPLAKLPRGQPSAHGLARQRFEGLGGVRRRHLR
jgi:hypothetical protein